MVEVAQRLAKLTPAQRQLLESRLKKNPQVAQPIAVVGVACRLPGAPNLDAYWRLISEARTAVTEIPADRWDVNRFYDRDPDTPGKMSIRWGAFLDNAADFDSLFFGITPREAVRMDPQQRILLEVTWEALENAGMAPDQMAGSSTGIFVGIGGNDYSKIPNQYDLPWEFIDAHMGTGNALSVAANRISYILDLRGPSMAIDTACSSGLVGTHMAIQGLRNGDCDAAIAGGVNMILSPEVTMAFSKARMLSATGECRPFDAAANGYVRGEGCVMVVLKRLTDATRDGDDVLAVIRGSAVNQDGRTSGISAPNSLSQQACIRAALASAGIEPLDVSYIEAHGTGTPLGDPIEFQSLGQLFERRREDEPPVYVSSVKSNVGHTETVSGMAGLVKVILMMKHGVIPPQARLETLNPNIHLDGTRLVIPREAVAWDVRGTRIAGISSFGFGGTNSHLVIESADSEPVAADEVQLAERPQHMLAISTKSKSATALKSLTTSYADRLEQLPDPSLPDFCFSANTGRSHFNHRVALIAGNREGLLRQLRSVSEGQRSPKIKVGEVRMAVKPKVAFLFTGQGSQYPGMAQAFYDQHPVFRQEMDRCDEILRDHRHPSLLEVLYGDGGQTLLHETSYTQPALFMLEYALAMVWKSWGVEPAMLLGHSVGEYVAACLAGVFSLEDGLKLIAKRAELMQQLPQDGKMAVIFASRDRVNEVLARHGDQVAVATANGPENNVISGLAESVEEVVLAFEKEGVGTQRLNVSHAFHSPLMDPMLDAFEAFAAGIAYHRPTIPIVANLTGRVAETAEFDAAYWRDHIRNAVEFSAGMSCLREADVHALLEIGPSANLLGMGRRCLPNFDAAWVPSLRKGRPDWDTMMAALADLYVLGVDIDWRGFDAPWNRQHVELPNYPFQRNRHWLTDGKPLARGGATGPLLHPLLGARVATAFESNLFEARLSSENPKYLHDHQVQGSVVVPATVYIEHGLAASQQLFGEGGHAIENLTVQTAMFLSPDASRLVQTTASPELAGRSNFDIFSTSEAVPSGETKWQLHATGSLVHQDALGGAESPGPIDLEEIRQRVTNELTKQQFYDVMEARNLLYGPAFQGLGSVQYTSTEGLTELDWPSALQGQLDKYHFHPVLGDALMQSVAGTVPREPNGDFSPYTYVPVRLRRARILGKVEDGAYAYARRISDADYPSPEAVESDVFLLDRQGNILAEFLGVTVQRMGRAVGADDAEDVAQWLYEINWSEQPLQAGEAIALRGRYLLFADRQGYAAELADQIRAAGGRPILVRPGSTFARDNHFYQLRPTASEDYSRLFQDLAADKKPLTAIVHLWSLDCQLPSDEQPGALAKARDLGVASALRMVQHTARVPGAKPPGLWLVTQAAQCLSPGEAVNISQSPLWGLGRVAAIEHPELNCRLIDLDTRANAASASRSLVVELSADTNESQIAYRGDARYAARLQPAPHRLPNQQDSKEMRVPRNQPFRLRILDSGSFDSLRYETFQRSAPGEGQVEMEVQATGLNFSDVLKALGLYPGITDVVVPMGIEASGVVTAVGPGVERFQVGDEVMGVAPYSFASHALTADYALVPKPKNIDYEEAATIPITFLTAYYGLVRLAQLQRGERVLIHAGAGGVGQAAIQIAQRIGAEIFCTAGSDEKRDFLHALGVPHVLNSRTLDFADEIREITGREGIDVVLNSLPGDAITASLSILRAYGRFLEIGKIDIYSNSMIGLLPFQDNLSYFAIDLDRMLRQRATYVRDMFAEMMKDFERGIYQPLPFTRFSSAETIPAFRYMAQRKNIGKVVVAVEREGAEEEEAAPEEFAARRDGTYLITGGLGALGLQVASWLAEQGAGHVALLSRRKPSDDVRAAIREMTRQDVQILAIQGDVTDRQSLATALQQIPKSFPPLRGVVHAAGVLQDGVMFDMDLEQLDTPMRPKVDGAWNLHIVTRDQPLDFFVMFSSVACVLGSPGQSNYAAGNAFLDGLAALRQSQGLPAVSINWGPWADAGMAADAAREGQLASRGMGMLPSRAALDLMGNLLVCGAAQTAVMSVQWADLLRAGGRTVPPLLQAVAGDIDLSAGSDSAEDRAFRDALKNLSSKERAHLLSEFFATQLARIMGLAAEDIDVVQPLGTMGLDSLMAIELKNKIETRLQMALPMAVFMNEPSVATLAGYVAENFGKESTVASESDAVETSGTTSEVTPTQA